MLNTEDFIKRLEFIMEHYSLSASSFADKITVQRSSISHLLSGRNKPSLDFILKILDVFPELNLYWLLDGAGTYLKNNPEEIKTKNHTAPPSPISEKIDLEEKKMNEADDVSEVKSENLLLPLNPTSDKNDGKQIEKIVFFFTDGTFQDYRSTQSK